MRLLFFAGSTREGSFNKRLARLAPHNFNTHRI